MSLRTKLSWLKATESRKLTSKELRISRAPFAAKSFSELGLPQKLIERLDREGLTVPTDVQSSAIPTILKNHDVVIQSYTRDKVGISPSNPLSSRSTEGTSFHWIESGKKMEIEAVIVAPSRELGMQIVREVERLLGHADKRQVQQLKNKPVIAVGTPERIAEISIAGKLHTHGCCFLVLDEVDELLSFNFRGDTQRILEHVGRRPGTDPNAANGSLTRTERQTILVSATFFVMRAARSWGRDPLLVRAKNVVPLESVSLSGPVNLLGSLASSESTSKHQSQTAVESLPPHLKPYYCGYNTMDTLRRCVHALDAKCVIAFMNHNKQLKDAVFKQEARGINAAELHGDLGKLGLSTTLKKFRNGEIRVLVTNELSARGLDVPECDLVVNLDLPTDSVHYAHRAPRTGRLGRKGYVGRAAVDMKEEM
ncbi:LOW QUALITY PROTEIN: DEAD/DEAH box helicase domain [Dillenia turbinata]|uniref:RNA helicase n=1 Tax=Dillenia turbinata TaxID=194707 RepID=A0AAN8WGU3_9MAGN